MSRNAPSTHYSLVGVLSNAMRTGRTMEITVTSSALRVPVENCEIVAVHDDYVEIAHPSDLNDDTRIIPLTAIVQVFIPSPVVEWVADQAARS